MDFFGGDQWETLAQVKAHLIAKHTAGARARAIGFGDPVCVHVSHEIFILVTDRVAHGMTKEKSTSKFTC